MALGLLCSASETTKRKSRWKRKCSYLKSSVSVFEGDSMYALLKRLFAKVLRVLLNLAHSIRNAEKQSFPLLALLTFSHTGTRESEEVKIAFIAWVYLAALRFGLSVTVRELCQWSSEERLCAVWLLLYTVQLCGCVCVSPCVR